MRRHRGGGEHGRVDRDLVHPALEGAAGGAPRVVAADAPVAVVALRLRLAVLADEVAVHVQLQAVGSLRRDHVVPLAVVVGAGRAREVGLARPRAELQASVVLHVDVAVVAAGEGERIRVVAEADQLAAARGGRLEPHLERVGGRVRDPLLAHRDAGGERRRLADRTREGAGLAEAHVASDVGADVVLPGVLERRRAVGVVEAPVGGRVGRVDGLAVGVRGRRRDGRGAAGRDQVVDDVGAREGGRVDRHLGDVAGQVVAPGLVGPAAEVVAADAPVARVVLAPGRVRALAGELAVDEQLHALRAHGGDDLVPLPVVEPGGRAQRLGRAGVDAEEDPAVVVEVDHAVVVARRARVAAAEADDLAARGGGRLDPRLHAEGVRRLHRLGRDREGPVLAGEGGGGGSVDGARCAARGVVDPEVLERDVVEAGGAAVLVERVVRGRAVVLDARGVGVAARLVGDGDGRGAVAVGGVPGRVGHDHLVGVRAAGREALVDEAHRRPVPEGRVLRDLVDGRRGLAVADHLVGEARAVAVEGGLPGDAGLALRVGDRLGDELVVAVRADLVGGVLGHRVADEALLRGGVHERELAADDDVVLVAVDAPGRLALAGEGSRDVLREPVEQRRGGRAGPVVVAVGVGRGRARRGLREREAVLERPRLGLREAADVAAVVRVARDVRDLARREDRVGVAVAVLDPGDDARVRVGREGGPRGCRRCRTCSRIRRPGRRSRTGS